jgi:hypothetical protein
VFHIGTDLAKVHFGQISTNMKCVEILYMRHFVNRCRELPLENVSEWSTKPNVMELGIFGSEQLRAALFD